MKKYSLSQLISALIVGISIGIIRNIIKIN